MYDVERTHCQSLTEQPGELAAVFSEKRWIVPLGASPALPRPWSSPVSTTAALLPFGRYQKRGIGVLAVWVMRLASRRCCSSADGIAARERSSHGRPLAALPKNMSSARTSPTASLSRSRPAHAGLPCRVSTTERERS